jgi:NitT/TauT family transport system substrate-binding protein
MVSMRRWFAKFLVGACVVALAGCGSGSPSAPAKSPDKAADAPAKAAEPAAAPKVETMTVKVGSTEKAALKNLPMFLTGFPEAAGVKVEYQEYKGGSEVAKALLNGEIDMAFVAVDQVLKDKSGEFRLVAMVTNGPGQALLVDSKLKESIKSVKDLAGKTVGVSSLGSGPHKTLTQLLTANGIDPKSVQVLPVGNNANEVLGTGKVAAMVTIEPYITLAEQSGKGVVLVDARKPDGIKAIYGTPEVPWIGLVTKTSVIQQNPAAVERMVSLVVKSLKYMAEAQAADVAKKAPSFFKEEVGGDDTAFAKMWDGNKVTFSKNGAISREALGAQWKDLQASGSVNKDQAFPFEQLTDTKFLDKVSSN